MNDKLRESNASKDGATQSSLGDASMADLKDGFCKIDGSEEYGSRSTSGDKGIPQTAEGGFLGRPHGWER